MKRNAPQADLLKGFLNEEGVLLCSTGSQPERTNRRLILKSRVWTNAKIAKCEGAIESAELSACRCSVVYVSAAIGSAKIKHTSQARRQS
jgi:hypothetical protein